MKINGLTFTILVSATGYYRQPREKSFNTETIQNLRQNTIGNKIIPNLKHLDLIEILYPDHQERNDHIKLDIEISNLKTIDLSGKNIENFPKSLFRIQNITKINISNNIIKEIPQDLPIPKYLEHINISNNLLEQVPKLFSKIPSLKYLDVSGNNITEFPEKQKTCILEIEITKKSEKDAYFCTIEHIDLSRNMLTWLDESIFEIKNLKTIIVNENKIHEILIDKVINNSQVEKLEINTNYLTDFNVKLPKLKEIDISNNFIEKFPESLCDLKSLEIINISNNALKEFPPSGISTVSLKKLDLSSNMLDSIDFSGINNSMDKLVHLDLKNNFLKSVPEVVKTLHNLKFLDLECNNISELPGWFSKLQNLEYLSLSNNLTNISKKLNVDQAFKLKSLKTLKLKCTEFKKAEDYDNFEIEELDIGYCRLLEIPDFVFKLKKLKKLNVSGNGIYEINENIKFLEYLEDLDLSENEIQQIEHLSSLKKLKILNFAFNNPSSGKYDFCEHHKLSRLDLSVKSSENIILKSLKIPDTLNVLCINGYKKIEQDFFINQSSKNLDTIKMIGCNLKTIPDFICKFENLLCIDLSYNLIENPWEQLKHFKRLRKINLTHNLIDNLEIRDNLCKNLEYLNISKNNIMTLPSDFKNCKGLKVLIIFDCNIKNFDFDFSSLANLTTLVTDAPFKFYDQMSKKSIFDCKKLKTLVLPSIKFINHLPDNFKRFEEMKFLALNLKYEKYLFSKLSDCAKFFNINVFSLLNEHIKLTKYKILKDLMQKESSLCVDFDSIEDLESNNNHSFMMDDLIYTTPID